MQRNYKTSLSHRDSISHDENLIRYQQIPCISLLGVKVRKCTVHIVFFLENYFIVSARGLDLIVIYIFLYRVSNRKNLIT